MIGRGKSSTVVIETAASSTLQSENWAPGLAENSRKTGKRAKAKPVNATE
jgi:hypothetical protein